MNYVVHSADIQPDHQGCVGLGLPINEHDPKDVTGFVVVTGITVTETAPVGHRGDLHFVGRSALKSHAGRAILRPGVNPGIEGC